jgi:hypothetical protein
LFSFDFFSTKTLLKKQIFIAKHQNKSLQFSPYLRNQDQQFMDYEHGQNKPSRFNDPNGPGNQQRAGGVNNRMWNDRRGGDDFQNKRRRF